MGASNAVRLMTVRLFYVAATRAADALYVSGNETSSGDGWLAAALEVVGTASRDGVEVRQPLIVGGGGGARRPAPRSWNEGGVAFSPWRVRTLPNLRPSTGVGTGGAFACNKLPSTLTLTLERRASTRSGLSEVCPRTL